MDHYLSMQAYEDIYYLPPPKWLQVMSLGHRRAVADLIWLRALIYFGDEFVNRGAVKLPAGIPLDRRGRCLHPDRLPA